MTKTPIRKPRRAPRNPHARALRNGRFRAKVVERVDRYKRKKKHKKPPEVDETT